MSTPPRRRRPAGPNSKSEGGGWLPTIAMGLGVVVAGLAIGALVAVFMQRGGGGPAPLVTPLAVVTSTPGATAAAGAAPTPRPIAIATFEPPRTPRPAPSPSPSPTKEATEHPTSTPTPTAPPTTKPRAQPSIVAVRPKEVAQAVAVPLPTATPVASVSTTPPSAPPAPVAPPETPSAYDEHASAVVRRYVDALIRGDEQTAYSALGGSGTLSERAFLDPSARIVLLKVTRIDASNASVGCEIATAKGNYYGTYHVTAASSGPYISQHDYIKV